MPIETVNALNAFFMETKANNVLTGEFTKVLYSDHTVTMNGIYVDVPICTFAGTEAVFDPAKNAPFVRAVHELERALLLKYASSHHTPKNLVYGLHRAFMRGRVKVYMDPWRVGAVWTARGCVLKISGVWETDSSVGVTYKFMETRLEDAPAADAPTSAPTT
jgi:hypothetical protein